MIQPVSSHQTLTHYLGRMQHLCPHCHALHWLDGRLSKLSARNPRFGSCCLSGKVSINFVAYLPPELYNYFVSQEDDAVEFHSHIWRYNKAFAFTSSGGPWCLDGTVFDGHGPPTFKIQGELYHQIGPLFLEDGRALLYSQLYIFNPIDALDHRQHNNLQTRPHTMETLQHLLLDCNPFVSVYEHTAALSHTHSFPSYHLKLDFLEASDRCRYNLPNTHHELAAIIPGDIECCIDARNVIIREKGGPLMHITEIHPSYIPLHFPLLAPTGQSGWHCDLHYTFTTRPHGASTREFILYCDFLKHRLHIRPFTIESDHYFWAGFLFQEYIVDSWAAAEHSWLKWYCVTFGLHFTTQTCWTAPFTFLSLPFIKARVRYDLTWFSCTIRSGCVLVNDINLRATHTTILSIRGVTIPIYLVSIATDSIG